MYKLLLLGIFLNCLVALQGCVHLTVSSDPPNFLEVHWDCEDITSPIYIYDKDPTPGISSKSLDPLLTFATDESMNNYYRTNITIHSDHLPGGWSKDEKTAKVPKSQCMYWIVAFIGGRMSPLDCFKIQPAWMAENKADIGLIPLPYLFIPGTHNSGSTFMKSTNQRAGISHMDNLLLNQDQSIWNQLVYGIRFFDFRIGHYISNDPTQRFWINHDMIRVQPLLPVLREIAKFIKHSPDEIIILDFHRFPIGFNNIVEDSIHRELIKTIEQELGYLAVPRPKNQAKFTLANIWNTNKRLIICYNKDNMMYETKWLWPGVSQRWGNKHTPKTLKAFLDQTFTNTMPRKLWAAMAELTPTPLHFLGKNSLKTLAQEINKKISEWFETNTAWKTQANIVAVDFFRGTSIIDTAIKENIRRGKNLKGKGIEIFFDN